VFRASIRCCSSLRASVCVLICANVRSHTRIQACIARPCGEIKKIRFRVLLSTVHYLPLLDFLYGKMPTLSPTRTAAFRTQSIDGRIGTFNPIRKLSGLCLCFSGHIRVTNEFFNVYFLFGNQSAFVDPGLLWDSQIQILYRLSSAVGVERAYL
jgi:hypothetical protein